jgi:hypothetical protein
MLHEFSWENVALVTRTGRFDSGVELHRWQTERKKLSADMRRVLQVRQLVFQTSTAGSLPARRTHGSEANLVTALG